MKIEYTPIGIIHSPFADLAQMPIQPRGEASAPGTVEIFPEYADGLRDLDGFSHILLLYHFHKAGKHRLLVTPFLDSQPHGIFATRAPLRPNPIGLSVVRLTAIEVLQPSAQDKIHLLHVEDLDILDGTPLLDIKPFIPAFDWQSEARIGWLEGVIGNAGRTVSDDRFTEG